MSSTAVRVLCPRLAPEQCIQQLVQILLTTLAWAPCTRPRAQEKRTALQEMKRCSPRRMLLLRTQLAQAQCTHPQRKSTIRHCGASRDVLCGCRCGTYCVRTSVMYSSTGKRNDTSTRYSSTGPGATNPTGASGIYSNSCRRTVDWHRREVLKDEWRCSIDCTRVRNVLAHGRRSYVRLSWCDVLDDRHSRTLRVLARCTSPCRRTTSLLLATAVKRTDAATSLLRLCCTRPYFKSVKL